MILVEGRNAAILVRCTGCGGQTGIGPGSVELHVAADTLQVFQKNHLRCKDAQGSLIQATALKQPQIVQLAPSDPAKADAEILRARMGKIG